MVGDGSLGSAVDGHGVITNYGEDPLGMSFLCYREGVSGYKDA